MTWAPAECTLPPVEWPLRVAEFDELFATALRGLARPEPTLLRLTLDGSEDVATTVRDLVDREAACCSVFSFTLTRSDDFLQLEVRVPTQRTEVLDDFAARAAAATGSRSA